MYDYNDSKEKSYKMTPAEAKMFDRAIQRANDYQQDAYQQRMESLTNRRFATLRGEQWTESMKAQFENRTMLEFNLLMSAQQRIISELRNNRIDVSFSCSDGGEEPDLIDAANGLYRADSRDSNAEEAHYNALGEAILGGFGAFRLVTAYEDELDEEGPQRIRIEPIYDADCSVFFDTDAKRQDKRDAKYCFVLFSVTKQRAEEEYGCIPTSMPMITTAENYKYADMYTPDVVYLAEYYEKVVEDYEVIRLEDMYGNITEVDKADYEEMDDYQQYSLGKKIASIKKRRYCIYKYILSGDTILENCGKITGSNIPIIPVYGQRWFIQNVERMAGIVQATRDPCCLINFILSGWAEQTSTSGQSVPIMYKEAVEGVGAQWATHATANYAYLTVNQVTDMKGNSLPPIVGQTKPPELSPASVALAEQAQVLLSQILGKQDEGKEVKANISGKAIQLVQARIDMQIYVYMDNFRRAIKRSGEIWQDMARELYIEPGRRMKIIPSSMQLSEVSSIMLGEKITDKRTGAIIDRYDLSRVNMDAEASLGAAFSSQKEALVNNLLTLLPNIADPKQQSIITATILMNLPFNGLTELNKYYRMTLVRLGVLTPSEEEAQELARETQQEKPSPEDEYLRAEAIKSTEQARKFNADAELSAARVIETQAKAEKIIEETKDKKADTAKKLVDMYSGARANERV